jgi:NADH-quinone oxidoreductase subunit M
MASVGLPGTSGFVGEFLALVGAYQISTTVAAVATTGIILGACYMLYLYWRVAFGKLTKPDVAAMPDLNPRELAMLGSIGLAVLWMGIYPESFMAPMRKDVSVLIARVERAKPPGDAQLRVAAVRPAPAGEHGGRQ